MITESEYKRCKAICKEFELQEKKELYWKTSCKVWFDWYGTQRKNEEPDFSGSAPKDLKEIIRKVREKCKKHELEWSEDIAGRSLLQFFNLCLKYQFTSDKLMLSLFNKYFQEITQNGKANTTNKRETAAASDLQTTLTGFAQDYFQQ